MPYKNVDSKKLHNASYNKANYVTITINRMMKRNQTNVSQTVYDKIKDDADPEFLKSLILIKSMKQKSEEKIKKYVEIKEEVIEEVVEESYTLENAVEDINSYPDWSVVTKKKYILRMNQLIKLLGCTDQKTNIIPLLTTNIDEIESKVYENHKLNTKDIFNVVASLAQKASPMFQKLMTNEVIKAYREKEKVYRMKTSLRDIDRVNFDTAEDWGKIKKAGEEIHEDARVDQEALIVSLYTDNHVVRDDYGEIEMIYGSAQKRNKDTNYYIVKTGMVILNQYKTSRKRGEYSFKLNTKTKGIIDKQLEADGKRKWLLYKSNDESIGKLSNNNYIAKAFSSTNIVFESKKISVNVLRHSVITHALKDNDMTGEEKNELALKMLSNVFVQQLVYRRKS